MGTSPEVIAARKCSRQARLISTFPGDPGAREPDPQAGWEVPHSWQADHRPGSGPCFQRCSQHEGQRKRWGEVAAPSHPLLPWVSLSFSSQGCLSLPSWLLGLFSISYNSAGKGKVDSSKPLLGLDGQIHCLRRGLEPRQDSRSCSQH